MEQSAIFFKPIAFVRPVEYNIRSIALICAERMQILTARQPANLWYISERRVQILCAEGRIPGVFKLGDAWAIPADSSKPCDSRLKQTKKEQPVNECN